MSGNRGVREILFSLTFQMPLSCNGWKPASRQEGEARRGRRGKMASSRNPGGRDRSAASPRGTRQPRIPSRKPTSRDRDNGTRKSRIGADAADHWAFLEEIEAPMWVDLTEEAQRGTDDIDDAWFRTTHPAHELSSHHLKLSVRNITIQEQPEDCRATSLQSPILPDSVSRSRGKHYNPKKLYGNDIGISSSKQHPVRKLSAYESSKLSLRQNQDPAKSTCALRCSSYQVRYGSRSKSLKADTAGVTAKRNPICYRNSMVNIASSNGKPSTSATGGAKAVITTKNQSGTVGKFLGRNSASDQGEEQRKQKLASGSERLRKPLGLVNGVVPAKKVPSNCEKNTGVGEIIHIHEDPHSKGRKKATAATAPTRLTSAKYLR